MVSRSTRGGVRLAALLIVAVLASACAARLAYDNVDTLVAWQADDLLDLTTDQRSFVRQRVQYHQSWHRRDELQRYAAFLDATAAAVADGLTAGEVDAFIDELRGFRATLVDVLAPDVAYLLMTLSDEQIDHFAKALRKGNRDLEERAAVTPARRAEKHVDMAVERIERWTGRLDATQRARVAAAVRDLPDTTPAWLTYTRQRQARLLGLLRDGRDSPDFVARVHDWLQERPDAQFRDFQPQLVKVVLAVDAVLRPAQRAHVLSELQKLRRDADHLRAACAVGC